MQPIPTIKSTSSWLRILRQLKALLRPLHFSEERNRKYGDFYQITFKNSPPTIITSKPQAIKDIFTASSDTFEVGIGNKGLNFLVGDNSLLLLDGSAHKHRRQLLMPSFHGESLQKFSQEIINLTNKVIDTWQINQSFNVRAVMQEITLRVILTAIFGIDSGARADKLRTLLTALLEIFNNPLNSSLIFFPILQKDLGKFSPWGRFLSLKQEIRTLIYAEIQERRELLASGKLERRDIFSLLLLAKDENDSVMTDEELHDELITLLFAGHETTASALSWLFYWIHYLPEVQELNFPKSFCKIGKNIKLEFKGLLKISNNAVNNFLSCSALVPESIPNIAVKITRKVISCITERTLKDWFICQLSITLFVRLIISWLNFCKDSP